MFKDICINSKSCELMKSVNKPKYGSRTILTDSCWEYVALFLKRQSMAGASDALFYWEQAHSFYLASQELPDNARPLTSYYCIFLKCFITCVNLFNYLMSSSAVVTVKVLNSYDLFPECFT